jgi:hypothetical protein
MKTTPCRSLLRTVGVAALLSAVSSFAGPDQVATSDPAARLLSSTGFVPVQNAGPYVERGTFRVQVSTKLGRPDLVLSDGTWLYHHRLIDGSAARGTLVVRFEKGRVSDLTIAGPAIVAALQADPRKPFNAELVATK